MFFIFLSVERRHKPNLTSYNLMPDNFCVSAGQVLTGRANMLYLLAQLGVINPNSYHRFSEKINE